MRHVALALGAGIPALAVAQADELPGLQDLLRYGLLGIFLVLVFAASMTGVIMWGPSVKALVTSKDEQIADLKAQRGDLIDINKGLTEALNRSTAATEERNRIDREERRNAPGGVERRRA